MTSVMKKGNGHLAPAAANNYSDAFFPKALSRFFDDDFWGFNGQLASAQVPVNIRETDQAYTLEVVAPGLKKDAFSIRMDGDLLHVGFEHKEEQRDEAKDGAYLRTEFRQQSFSRSFRLDDTIDAGRISARYQDGVLHVTLPKKEGAQRIRRDIEVA